MSTGRSGSEEGRNAARQAELIPRPEAALRCAPGRLPGLDRLARLAARLLGAPLAAILVADGEGELCLGSAGWPDDPADTPRSSPPLAQEVASGEPLILADARLAPHSVLEALGIAGFAGFPLRSAAGEVVGIFCAADRAPRQWTEGELGLLGELCAVASEELCLHQTLGEHAELLDALQRSLEANKEAMATVAHDLRSPLHGALLVLQIMEAQGPTPETNGVLGRALRSMNEILGQRLSRESRARQEAVVAPLPLDPLELLHEVRALFAPRAAAEGIVLSIDHAQRLPEVEADLPRLRQALSSLLANAFRRTSRGGRIVLAVRPLERGVRLEVWPGDRQAGGVAPDPGFGLVRAIVLAHGGEAGVEESGCAWITLPALVDLDRALRGRP